MNLNRAEIDTNWRRITLSRRRAYFFKKAYTINFSDILYLKYSYNSLATDWGFSTDGFGTNDQLESFTIYIVTKDEEEHFLCSFRGEGSVETGWCGVLFGNDELLDFSGTQEAESRQLVGHLAKIIGVTVGKPLDASTKMTKCPECNHLISNWATTCLYCGAEVNS